MKSAVLFLIFNRPELTEKTFNAIREARPSRLYVAADGPRSDRPDEAAKCEQTRKISTAIDWPCELKTLFRDKNLGCKLAVAGAIDWFFENEEEGIILEDDVLPIPSFFRFCDELLEKYRHNQRIAMIGGWNMLPSDFTLDKSYFFSRYTTSTGWATWRRIWKHFDINMKAWPSWRDHKGLNTVAGNDPGFVDYWTICFNTAYSEKNNSIWDYIWVFTCWKLGMLCIMPTHSQASNIGFGKDATHTICETPPDYVISSIPKELSFPLIHPEKIERCVIADSLIHKLVFKMPYWGAIKLKIKKIPFVGKLLLNIKNFLLFYRPIKKEKTSF